MPMISRNDAEALIQEQLINTISQDAPKQSIFMQLAKKLPNMTSKQTRIPVLDMLPVAFWVNGDTGFKQTSQQAWDNVFLNAEELAVIVPIPESVIADASFDIMGEVQPRVMEAIGQCVDSAVLFGVNRPASRRLDTEGCNNKTKVLKRISYGVRNFERFKKRIEAFTPVRIEIFLHFFNPNN